MRRLPSRSSSAGASHVAGAALLAAVAAVASTLGAQAPVAQTRPAAPAPAPAPPALAAGVTLDAAVARALAQGPSARIARSALEAARSRDRAFQARLLPQLSLSGNLPNFNRAISPIVQPDGTIRYVGQRLTTSSALLTASQPLPLTGGQLFVTSGLERTDVSGDRGTARLYQSSPVIVGIRQQLFRPNVLAWNAREQDLQLSIADRQYVESREDAAASVVTAFFDLYAAQMNLANAETNAAVNDSLFVLSKGRYEVGKIGENDLLQSELALLRARASVDEVRLVRDRARASLNLLLGAAPDAPVAVAAPTAAPLVAPDPELAVTEARRNASQTTSLELREVRAERGVREAKLNNGLGATVTASAGFNQTSNTGFDAAYRSLLDQQRVGVSVEVPLIQWRAGRASVDAARADRQRVETETRLARLSQEQEARFAALQVAQAGRQLGLAAKADTVGEKRFEIAKNRYLIGKIGIGDLFIAQSEKDAARQASIQALRGYWLAYYRLRRLTLYDFAVGDRLRPDA